MMEIIMIETLIAFFIKILKKKNKNLQFVRKGKENKCIDISEYPTFRRTFVAF